VGTAHLHPSTYHHPIGNTNSNSLLNPQMPDYQRAYTPGGAIFLTLVTFNRSSCKAGSAHPAN